MVNHSSFIIKKKTCIQLKNSCVFCLKFQILIVPMIVNETLSQSILLTIRARMELNGMGHKEKQCYINSKLMLETKFSVLEIPANGKSFL